MPLRWGILGAGSIARKFASDLKIINERGRIAHEITAVSSRDESRAQAFASEFDIRDALAGYQSLAEHEDVDVIYIANVHSHHRDAVLQMLSGDKHVLCEKPFAINAKQAREMIESARSRKLFLMEAMWTRFLPHIVALLDEIKNGAIGEVISIDADHGQWLYKRPDHRVLDHKLGGGALLDLGVYPITFAHLILGLPAKFEAVATLADNGIDDQTSMIFSYPSGATATLHTTIKSATGIRAVVAGTKGRLEVERSFYAPSGFTIYGNDGSERTFHPYPFEDGYVGLGEQAIEVARCIEAGLIESPMRPLAATLEVMELMDSIRERIGLRYPGEIGDTDDSRSIS